VEQRVDRLVDPPGAPPGGEQDREIGGRLTARVVAHDEERAALGQPLEPADLGAEPRGIQLQHGPDPAQEGRVPHREDRPLVLSIAHPPQYAHPTAPGPG
jgi:hypothetical protein